MWRWQRTRLFSLEAESEEGTGTPFGLPRVVVVVAQERGVEEEGGAYKVFPAEVIDDGNASVGDQLGEIGFSVARHAVLLDVDIVEDNQTGLGRSMEEPFARHKVVAVATTNGKSVHGGA